MNKKPQIVEPFMEEERTVALESEGPSPIAPKDVGRTKRCCSQNKAADEDERGPAECVVNQTGESGADS